MNTFIIFSEEQWYAIPKEKEADFKKRIGNKRKGKIDNADFYVTDSNTIKLRGKFLNQNIKAFYHADYKSGNSWKIDNSIENLIWTLKNDVNPFPDRLTKAQQQLSLIIKQDLQKILEILEKSDITVCVVPRAKSEGYYRADQLLFRKVISDVVDTMPNVENGTKYIIRHTNTRTTHLDKAGKGGDGNLPYPGITKDTCAISEKINGKDILLIDDLYTKGVNIDEDAIQALLDKGANSVTFYSVGKTVSRNQ